MGRRSKIYWDLVNCNLYRKRLNKDKLGLFLLLKIKVVILVKRNIRYFVASVQCLYNEYITALMDMGNGYTHPEECYIPTFLYPELLRKSAEYNNIEWEEESIFKGIRM